MPCRQNGQEKTASEPTRYEGGDTIIGGIMVEVLFVILILFGLYTIAFVIPRQLKDISEHLEDIKKLLTKRNKSE